MSGSVYAGGGVRTQTISYNKKGTTGYLMAERDAAEEMQKNRLIDMNELNSLLS